MPIIDLSVPKEPITCFSNIVRVYLSYLGVFEAILPTHTLYVISPYAYCNFSNNLIHTNMLVLIFFLYVVYMVPLSRVIVFLLVIHFAKYSFHEYGKKVHSLISTRMNIIYIYI